MSEEYTNEVNETEAPQSLDNPLVVHKKGDASYEESAAAMEMSETHLEDDSPTLSRHRFKREKKSKKPFLFLLVFIIFLAVAFGVLYATGNITFNTKETTQPSTVQTTQTTTSLEQAYQGTVVVKDMYIFVNGVEVDGINGLQKALRYEDVSTTAFKIIDEDANADYLNYEILPVMQEMGFYGEDTVITHIESTGLIAEAETTTLPPETTTTTTTKTNTTNTDSEGYLWDF